MSTALETEVPVRWGRTGETARDLMTPNPVSIHGGATLAEVVAFLVDSGYSAAPVIDDAGHPIGVVSRTDIITYDRAHVAPADDVPGYYDRPDLRAGAGEGRPGADASGPGADVCATGLMTPAVFSVTPETPAEKVAEQMVQLNVHRLFVVDRQGVLIGVISALDLLRHFCS